MRLLRRVESCRRLHALIPMNDHVVNNLLTTWSFVRRRPTGYRVEHARENRPVVTIRDVAKAAGVSHKTVSRVVNGELAVTAATRERVQQVITAMDYVPNQGARLMRKSRSGVIGVMTDVVATSPNSTEILHGIQDAVAATPYSVLIANTGDDPDTARKSWRAFQQHRIDGLLYVTMYHHGVRLPAELPDVPLVLVNCFDEAQPGRPSVLPDDFGGGLAAARLAIARGHRRIAFITLNPEIPAARLRADAFRQAMAEARLPLDPALVVSGYTGAVGQEQLVAFSRAGAFFARPPERRPSVVLTGNDEIALQVICAAAAAGLRVPDDVAVIGFDDFRMISTSIVPALTTVALPYHAIGVRATERLMARIAGGADAEGAERIPCPVVERDSA